MKIDSAEVRMGSARVFAEKDSKQERLNAWVGKRPDSGPRDRADRLTLSAMPPAPAPKPPETKEKEDDEACCKGLRGENDDEVSMRDGYVYVLKRAVEALTGKKIHMRRVDPDALKQESPASDALPEALGRAQQAEGGAGWGVEYDKTTTHYEYEQTSFAAEGVIRTADGKEIGFSLDLQMSRELMTSESVSLRAGDAIQKVDPLVLNFEGNAAELTDAKFAFDLDQDGDQENVSFVGSGSGVLVLDRNRDGIVNDGGELFGPSTGNGFNELAALDGDQNGWIDENDSAYADLSVWTKTDEGKDVLTGLKNKNVGAIYLGNAQTQFDIKSGSTLHGQVTRTGVFAEEDGGVGTIQQVDLVT